MQVLLGTQVVRGGSASALRRFTSIFDVIRQRRRDLSREEADDAQDAHAASAATDASAPTSDALGEQLQQLCKQFSILRTKPKGYRDLQQMRHIGLRTLELLPITSAEELGKMTEVLAHLKYRNVPLLQGVAEAMYWHCKLNKCKLRDMTRFLRACSALKYVPSYRHLQELLAQLDNPHFKPSVGDYLRVLQFIVGNDLSCGDAFIAMHGRCYNHCIENMGYMAHRHLASFSQVQLVIDKTDSGVMDRICLNFERNIKEADQRTFMMLSNSMLRSDAADLSPHYRRVLMHYLEHHDTWAPELAITVLALLKRHYHRDTVALSKLGQTIVNNIGAFDHGQATIALNHYAALSYKHKRLLHGVVNSHLLAPTDGGNARQRLMLMAAVANMLAKVNYKPIELMKRVVEHTAQLLEGMSGQGNATIGASASVACGNTDRGGIPLMVYEDHIARQGVHGCYETTQPATTVITGDMLLDMVSPAHGAGRTSATPPVELKHDHRAVRRLLWRTRGEDACENTATADLSRLKVVPVSVEVRRQQTLKECLQHFYNAHFNGIHPAHKRIEARRQMRRQAKRLSKRLPFGPSTVLHSVHLEANASGQVNRSVRKVKRKMQYAGSRYVQSTQHYINECRVLKRCFLRPYKTAAAPADSPPIKLAGDASANAMVSINEDTRRNDLVRIWKCHVRGAIAQPSTHIASSVRSDLQRQVHGALPSGAGLMEGADDVGAMESPESVVTAPDAEAAASAYDHARGRQRRIMQGLEQYVGAETPIFVDNRLFMKPVELPSLFSWRLKRKMRAMERDHSTNAMAGVVSYMMSNGLWRKPVPPDAVVIRPRAQPVLTHTFDIVSALHRLGFTSFQLLSRVTATLRNVQPLPLLNKEAVAHIGVQETGVVLWGVLQRFGYMVAAITGMMERDASGVLAARLLAFLCTSNILRRLEIHVVGHGVPVGVTDIAGAFRSINTLVYFKYGRLLQQTDEKAQADDGHVVVGGAIDFTKAARHVIPAYDSLISIAECAMGVKDGSLTKCGSMSAGVTSLQFMRLLDEVVYSQWVMLRANCRDEWIGSGNQEGAQRGAIVPLGERVAEALLSSVETSEDDKRVAMHAICAIQRHRLLQKSVAGGGHAKKSGADGDHDDDKARTQQWATRLCAALERYTIGPKNVEASVDSVYHAKSGVDLPLGPRDHQLRSGMVAVKTTGDGPAEAAGVLHNFYTKHYQAA